MAPIKLNYQFIYIIIRQVRISEFAGCYLNVRVDSLLFLFFFIFLLSQHSFLVY